ncbi:hypothetical protein GCM10028803_00610 [Larkinella knui]|uniref:Putative auto-transporter adhesin head GIN domain-containing protein n=1 Tax=Larkinella knui TaxID=2025310 RepID=A0A3P1CMC6_9BACT|nr:DUF2807 domain-containing protein [Larkinella knui]RRB14226.1 hypothetical protein EHT87_18515 [Larkinella knui]
MKLTPIVLGLLAMFSAFGQTSKYAASTELRGNGKLIKQQIRLAPFDRLLTRHFPAQITVEVGDAAPSATITMDENLVSFLRIDQQENALTLSFSDPQAKPFWISKATINVLIKTPRLSQMTHGSNSDVSIRGIVGDGFVLENEANGNVTLQGTTRQLTITSLANGTVHAEALAAKQARVTTQANATIYLNAPTVIEQNTAFAKVVNVQQENPLPKPVPGDEHELDELVTVLFQNNSLRPRGFTLISYAPGQALNETNGFRLGAGETITKRYLVGTKVYLASQDQVNRVMSGERLQSKPFLVISDQDRQRRVNLVNK